MEDNKNDKIDIDNFYGDLLKRMHQPPETPMEVRPCPHCHQPQDSYASFGNWVFEEDCGCGGYAESRRKGFLDTWDRALAQRVGKRHARVRTPLHETVKAMLEGAHEDTCCAYLWGGTGSGKTQQLIEAERHLQVRRAYAYEDHVYTSPNPQVFRPGVESLTEGRILDSLKPNAGGRQRSIEYYQMLPYLFIDDMGTSKITEWGYGQMFEIIDYRYQHEKSTIISSNVRLKALAQAGYDDRMLTRIFEMCGGMGAHSEGRLAVIEFNMNHRFGGAA
jgi:hypothetical protein